MSNCAELCERMPAVAGGRDAWSGSELQHLASCGDCAAEWRVVQMGVVLAGDVAVNADRIAAAVISGLRQPAAAEATVLRFRWRGPLVGIMAAAAAVALLIWAPRRGHAPGSDDGDSAAALAMLPELGGLSNGELAAVLQTIDAAPVDAGASSDAPHLDDLTDAQLERLLQSMGGSE